MSKSKEAEKAYIQGRHDMLCDVIDYLKYKRRILTLQSGSSNASVTVDMLIREFTNALK